MFGSHAIDANSTRSGRWLRHNRYRLTLWLAAIEGLFYLVGLLHRWEAIGLAVLGLLLFFTVARSNRSDTIRQVIWVFAVAQLLVVLVPFLFAVFKAIAIAIVVLLAIVALIVLFTDRR
jgi:heme A synthase